MTYLGKVLIVVGVILILIGLIFIFGIKIPYFGKLPGDIFIKKENFTFYFPLTTSIIISIVFSIILWFITKK
ncbi:MAG: DUF2905 domain-containing protein [Elusimicrobia bacterium CG06_land_8_20_14_3_00_38_11]|nr:MAG: DUF2905 domain-containing protein [Elusimicrobia bacterium CG06_land_8_20_14_3_00_38_11]